MRRQRDPRAKFARWIQEIEGLNYEIIHVKGNENGAADFLSRMHSDVDPEINDEVKCFERFVYQVSTYPDLVDAIKEEQLMDRAVSYARSQVLDKGFVDRGRLKNQHLTISNGLLLRNGRILVPESMKNSVLTYTHNKAHPGIRRTTFLVKERYT